MCFVSLANFARYPCHVRPFGMGSIVKSFEASAFRNHRDASMVVIGFEGSVAVGKSGPSPTRPSARRFASAASNAARVSAPIGIRSQT